MVIGVFAAVFSLLVGLLCLTGQGTVLPDLEDMLKRTFGAVPGTA